MAISVQFEFQPFQDLELRLSHPDEDAVVATAVATPGIVRTNVYKATFTGPVVLAGRYIAIVRDIETNQDVGCLWVDVPAGNNAIVWASVNPAATSDLSGISEAFSTMAQAVNEMPKRVWTEDLSTYDAGEPVASNKAYYLLSRCFAVAKTVAKLWS